MKKTLNEEFRRMQKLAGIINESQLNEEESSQDLSPEKAVDKAINLASKLEKSSELDALAQKISQDPNLMKQMEKALQKGGITLNEDENNLDTQDMKTIALNFAKKGQQVKEEEEVTWDDTAAGAYMGAFVGGGALAGSFSSAIAAAIPMAASVFAGPAFVGALAGVALVALARKVYLMTKK